MLLAGDGSRQKIIGFITSRLGGHKPAGGNELGQDVQLLNEFIVEDASGLIGFQCLVPVGGLSSVSQPTITARGCSLS